MDTTVLRKRLNTYKGGRGQLRQVESDVVMEVLRTWENWQGSAADLYRELGLSKMQLVTMIQKAKRLVRSGAVVGGEFKEITVSGAVASVSGYGIELSWDNGKLIRFSGVEQLIEFLKKSGNVENL